MTEVQEAPTQGEAEAVVEDEFTELLKKEFKLKPKDDEAKARVKDAVTALAEEALRDETLISDDIFQTIEAMIASIDVALSTQLNAVIHHPDFQQLERAWRGLKYLVNNTETDEFLKIRVMPITKNELGKELKTYAGAAWDQSPVFKKLYDAEYNMLGGEPFGAIVGDYYFSHSGPDVQLLTEMSKICAASHAPFISAADPEVFKFESWNELNNPRDLTKIFSTPDYAGWRSLRSSEDSRYLGLCMPRFLGRSPYGAKSDPVEEFDFEEEVSGSAESFCWTNSAYAMAVNINKSFKLYGWCSRIRGVEAGGAVEGLPTHTFPTDDGGIDMTCPTEIAIGDRREAELAKNGFMPLLHRKNTDVAAFIGAQSLQKPAEYDDPDVTANANLSARLPYLFATCRFAHYLKCIVRDKVGTYKSREEMEKFLKKWIMQYVDGAPETSSERTKSQKPLADAQVIVKEVEGNPGYYNSVFHLRPHFQLEGLTVSLRLVSKLPAVTS